MKRAILLLVATMTGCAPAARAPAPAAAVTIDLPDMRVFSAQAAPAPTRSNAEMARDFMDLSFRLESGRALPVFTRFEGPISIRVLGDAPPTLSRDLRQLVGRLQTEAGIDIFQTGASDAQITVQAIPSADLSDAVSGAACFVVPRVSSWREYRSARASQIDWATLTTRDRIAFFVPSDAAPQEIRTCLHEELAQALGPLNDLYRLPDSVFNDDDFHAVLTGFDMLMLRATYAPELRSGMSAAEVSARLPGILARLNPAGQTGAAGPVSPTTESWRNAMQTALTSRFNRSRRQSAAQSAVSIAQSQGWTGARLGFSLYAYGRITIGRDADAAQSALMAAALEFRRGPATQIHEAHVAVQLAAFALREGDAAAILSITDTAIPIATAHENAALLATLMMFRAEALDLAGRTSEASVVRLDSLGWARYGLGSDIAVQNRLTEIAALNPGPRS